MPFKIVRNDITKMQVDVIVNTADIESANSEKKLRSCYKNSLNLAHKYNCRSIAFPLISTGNLGYPKEEAMRIALDEINAFLLKHEMLVYMVVFDDSSTKLAAGLYPELEAYINQNYVDIVAEMEYSRMPLWPHSASMSLPAEYVKTAANIEPDRDAFRVIRETVDDDDELELFLESSADALDERMQHMEDTFQQYLMYLIESKGMSNAEVYKGAIISKQLFSKIKLNKNYHPDKATAMRLCVGAKLNLDETKDLLARAGYALSPCDKRDIIFSFFIEQEVFDMIEIDIALEEYGLPCFIE